MCIMPKMPAMPSADDMAKQQLEVQRQLQADADSRAAGQLEDERKKARRAQIRRNRRRRGRASLITSRDIAGGLLGATDMGIGANTISPLGTDLTQIGN